MFVAHWVNAPRPTCSIRSYMQPCISPAKCLPRLDSFNSGNRFAGQPPLSRSDRRRRAAEGTLRACLLFMIKTNLADFDSQLFGLARELPLWLLTHCLLAVSHSKYGSQLPRY